MQEVFKKVLKRDRLTVCVTSNHNQQTYISKRLHLLFKDFLLTHSNFTSPIPETQFTSKEESTTFQPKKDFYIIPGNANFVVESFNAPHYNHPDSVKLQIASRLNSTNAIQNAPQTLQRAPWCLRCWSSFFSS